MARFYFHIETLDGHYEQDDVGADFASEDAAIQEATALAYELMRDATQAGHDSKNYVEVADEHGNIVVRLDGTAAVSAQRES
jgi:hypothetical protein